MRFRPGFGPRYRKTAIFRGFRTVLQLEYLDLTNEHVCRIEMKRWDEAEMREVGEKLFAKIHKRKYHACHNHEVHFLAREINDWLPLGIKSLQEGNYDPRCLQRYYFSDEVVDQLHVSDRIFQNILLKQLKPTFQHVMNPNCYHILHGPAGVKHATQRIRQVLEEEKPAWIIRADVRSFYASIPHMKNSSNGFVMLVLTLILLPMEQDYF